MVPIDARLEAVARRLIASPGDFLPADRPRPKDAEDRERQERLAQGEKDLLRRQGVRALAHFQSKENVAALKPLLADPAAWVQTVERNGLPGVEERVYHIREAAYEVLRGWGVDVERPVLREAVPPKGGEGPAK